MSFSGAISGGLSGAGTGATVGSVIPGVGTAIGAGIGGLLGAAGGGLLGSKSSETRTQRKQRELVDEMLASLRGEGPYSSLFTASEADFEKSFAEPARARFRNQIAPQIQQAYIQGGQQRSTGLEDTLTRAGVDLDQLLNEQYMDYLQGAQNRQAYAMSNILGMGSGAQSSLSPGEGIMQGIGGYLSGDKFGKNIEDILKAYTNKKPAYEAEVPRKGFENDNFTYEPFGERFV